ncbi:MAG: hypothetical protein KBT01_00570 [Clostridiales bacterium]|nr:hypothetical protein [Candidatus Blautia equi]
MKRKGSITIFLALTLSVILSLVCTSIESVRMAAARTQSLCSLDIGLFSLFGQYDKDVWKDFDLFMLDGSCGGGDLKLANLYKSMEAYVKPVLKQNSQKISLTRGGFTGYQLMTDEDGEVFYDQIIQYMKDTLGLQGAQFLLDHIKDGKDKTEEAKRRGTELENGNSLDHYDTAMNSAAQSSRELEEKQRQEAEAAAEGGAVVPVPTQPPQNVVNPIGAIKKVMKMGLLQLVIPSGKGISEASMGRRTLVSERLLQRGAGVIRHVSADTSYASQLLYHQYLTEKLGNYEKPSPYGLAYQLEYIIGGKRTDMDNLLSIAKQLLVIREGVNVASIMSDPAKRAGIEALSLAIASTFLVPPAAGAIDAALVTCWAFAESVLDVRELFDGGKVPLVKQPQQWQLSLENLPNLLGKLDSVRKTDPDGLSYADYLQILLISKNRREKIKRGMDMVELTIRGKLDREDFKLDSGVVAVEAAIDVKANKRKNFTITKQYSYD